MENWKLLLPQGELEIKTSRQGSSTALLLAGGRKPASEWLVQIAASKDIYCADKGIECCCENNLKPVWLCGDADSAAKDCWEKAQLSGVKILLHDPLIFYYQYTYHPNSSFLSAASSISDKTQGQIKFALCSSLIRLLFSVQTNHRLLPHFFQAHLHHW